MLEWETKKAGILEKIGEIRSKLNNKGKGRSPDATGAITGANLTVYYNSVNPSMNSLLEFNVASKREYGGAGLWIAFGALGLFSFIFGLVLESTKSEGKSGEVIDFTGTVLYPEEMGLGSEFTRSLMAKPWILLICED